MATWLVHVVRTAGAVVLPLLATAVLLAVNHAGAFNSGAAAGINQRLPAATRAATPIPGAAHARAPMSAPEATPEDTPTATPTVTPIVEPTDRIRTTVYVTPSIASVAAGQSITITPQLVMTGTCSFPIMDVTLNQDPPLFAYSDPMDKVVRGGAASWRLTAFAAGTTTFTAVYFGETYCDGVWQWNYASGASEPITVTGNILGLPFAAKEPDS